MPYIAPNVRTLPLRVTPVPGEAIDSWLEAIAARHKATFGAVLAQCGITAAGIKAMPRFSPVGPIIDTIAYVAGVAPEVVSAMTLIPGCAGMPTSRRRRNGWQWRINSRACPQCLAETDGRWQLVWRHNLSFACVRHRCLLIDSCPACRHPLRNRPHRSHEVPAPGYCACSTQQRPGIPPLCGADLTTSVGALLDGEHPVLRAQARVDGLRSGFAFGLAGPASRPSQIDVLNDVTVLARWMVSAVDQVHLQQVLHALSGRPSEQLPRPFMDGAIADPPHDVVNPDAATTAVSVALALAVLDGAGDPTSRKLLQHIMTAAAPARLTRPIAHAVRSHLTSDTGAEYQYAFDKEYNERRILYRLALAQAVEAAPPVCQTTKWIR